jgi:hypothetical protein
MENNYETLKISFETINEYTLPEYLKETVTFSNFIHVNQLNDIKNQIYNHITFIGNYTDLFNTEHKQLKYENKVLTNDINFVYLDKELNTNEFKPNHTPFKFQSKYVQNLDDVFNGMVKQNDYYISNK